MDEILQNHRREIKQLQCEIQRLKKSVPKGDKKRSKEAQAIISNLENDLKLKQEKELSELMLHTELKDNHLIDENVKSTVEKSQSTQKKKKNKDKSQIYQDIIRKHEENDHLSDRHIELECIKDKLSTNNLKIVEIPADGNCLFNAIGFQCVLHKIFDFSTEFEKNEDAALYLRQLVSQEMKMNKDIYSSFVSCEESDDFDSYCEKICTTRMWGGQLEINALSEAIKCPIEIVQANVPSIIIGDCEKSPKLTITYHKFAYGLGEHYNSSSVDDEST